MTKSLLIALLLAALVATANAKVNQHQRQLEESDSDAAFGDESDSDAAFGDESDSDAAFGDESDNKDDEQAIDDKEDEGEELADNDDEDDKPEAAQADADGEDNDDDQADADNELEEEEEKKAIRASKLAAVTKDIAELEAALKTSKMSADKKSVTINLEAIKKDAEVFSRGDRFAAGSKHAMDKRLEALDMMMDKANNKVASKPAARKVASKPAARKVAAAPHKNLEEEATRVLADVTSMEKTIRAAHLTKDAKMAAKDNLDAIKKNAHAFTTATEAQKKRLSQANELRVQALKMMLGERPSSHQEREMDLERELGNSKKITRAAVKHAVKPVAAKKVAAKKIVAAKKVAAKKNVSAARKH